MKENILQAVAQPPKLLLAPFLPALISFVIHFLLFAMFIIMMKTGYVPYVLLSMILCHFILVVLGKREPHLSGILKSWFFTPRGTNNILKEKGDKYIP